MNCGDDQVDDEVIGLIKSIQKDLSQKKNVAGSIKLCFKNEEKTKYLAFLDKKQMKIFEKWLMPLEITHKSDDVKTSKVNSGFLNR